jgi:hypothetical protein
MHEVVREFEVMNAAHPALRDVGEADRGLRVILQQHVAGAQVAVRQAVLVQPGKGVRHLINVPPGLLRRQTAAGGLQRGRLPHGGGRGCPSSSRRRAA